MSEITVTVDDRAVQALLGRLQAKVSNLQPVMQGIGSDLVSEIGLGFKAGHDPWGQRWLPLKRARARNKAKGDRGVPLNDTGTLRNSFSARATNDSVVVGTNVPYAAIHQFGGTIEHAARSIRVRLRTDARGNLLRQGTEGKAARLAVFATDKHKRARTVWGEARAWSVHIPARPFLPIRGRKVDLPPSWLAAITGRIERRLAEATK